MKYKFVVLFVMLFAFVFAACEPTLEDESSSSNVSVASGDSEGANESDSPGGSKQSGASSAGGSEGTNESDSPGGSKQSGTSSAGGSEGANESDSPGGSKQSGASSAGGFTPPADTGLQPILAYKDSNFDGLTVLPSGASPTVSLVSTGGIGGGKYVQYTANVSSSDSNSNVNFFNYANNGGDYKWASPAGRPFLTMWVKGTISAGANYRVILGDSSMGDRSAYIQLADVTDGSAVHVVTTGFNVNTSWNDSAVENALTLSSWKKIAVSLADVGIDINGFYFFIRHRGGNYNLSIDQILFEDTATALVADTTVFEASSSSSYEPPADSGLQPILAYKDSNFDGLTAMPSGTTQNATDTVSLMSTGGIGGGKYVRWQGSASTAVSYVNFFHSSNEPYRWAPPSGRPFLTMWVKGSISFGAAYRIVVGTASAQTDQSFFQLTGVSENASEVGMVTWQPFSTSWTSMQNIPAVNFPQWKKIALDIGDGSSLSGNYFHIRHQAGTYDLSIDEILFEDTATALAANATAFDPNAGGSSSAGPGNNSDSSTSSSSSFGGASSTPSLSSIPSSSSSSVASVGSGLSPILAFKGSDFESNTAPVNPVTVVSAGGIGGSAYASIVGSYASSGSNAFFNFFPNDASYNYASPVGRQYLTMWVKGTISSGANYRLTAGSTATGTEKSFFQLTGVSAAASEVSIVQWQAASATWNSTVITNAVNFSQWKKIALDIGDGTCVNGVYFHIRHRGGDYNLSIDEILFEDAATALAANATAFDPNAGGNSSAESGNNSDSSTSSSSEPASHSSFGGAGASSSVWGGVVVSSSSSSDASI